MDVINSNGILLKDLMVLNYVLCILITYCAYLVSLMVNICNRYGHLFLSQFCCFSKIGSSTFEGVDKIFHFINIKYF